MICLSRELFEISENAQKSSDYTDYEMITPIRESRSDSAFGERTLRGL